MANRCSKDTSGMVVRFQEDHEEYPSASSEEDSIHAANRNLSRSWTNLNESTSTPDSRLHHTMPSRIRSRLSCENQLLSDKAHQIGRPSWSGGWQNTIISRRREGITPLNEEDELQEIAQAMQSDSKFMADSVDGQLMRRSTFREMIKSLTMRRQLKQRLSLVQLSDERSSLKQNIQYYFSVRYLKFQRVFNQLFHDYSLWNGNITRIEGIFGRNIGSFFYFLRDIVLLNIFMSVFICGFLLIPQTLHAYHGNASTNQSVSFGPLDLITGAGWLGGTELYYGGYATGNFNLFGHNLNYNMTHAYLSIISICHVSFLVILLLRVCSLYKLHYIDVRDGANCNFTRLVFTGWDFRITDDSSAKVKHSSLYNEFIESIQELMEDEEIDSFYRLLLRKAIQFCIWLILMSFLVLLSWGMYVFLNNEYANLVQQDISYLKESFNFLIFPLVVTAIMYVVPVVFDSIGRHELYMKKKTALYVTLIRVTILQLVILAVLFVFWYGNSPGLIDELPVLQMKADRLVDVFHNRNAGNVTVMCWETALGQEIYRLVLMDFVFILVNLLLVDRLRALLVKKGKLKETILEFNISANILHIIYNQTLLSAGLFFCPLLPVIVTVKFICIFYLHKFNLTTNLRPKERPWRASQSETLFNSLALFSLILAIFSYGFIIVRGYSSTNCGPFQGYGNYIDLLWTFSMDSERVVLQLVKWLLKPLSIVIIIGLLSIIIMCIKNVAEGRIEMVTLLQQQIQLEIQDKKFYLSLIDQVQRGNYKTGTSIRDLPPATTWERDLDSKNLSKRASFTFSKGNKDFGDEYLNGLINEENHYEDSHL